MPLPKFLIKPLSALCLLGLTAFAPSMVAQGVPHLTATPGTYHVLVPNGTTVTSAMCQPADSFCLANAVGHPLLTQLKGLAADSLGNIYSTNGSLYQVVKTTPSGQSTIIAGMYGVANTSSIAAPSGVAVNTVLAEPHALATDLAGDVFVADANEFSPSAFYGSILKIDPLGMVTRLTGDPSLNPTPADGVLASNQPIDPIAVATDLGGNVYFVDSNTCTVQKIVVATNRIQVIAGTIAIGCNTTNPAGTLGSNQSANSYQFARITDIAVGHDGTLYLTDGTYGGLYSVTFNGTLHLLVGGAENTSITSGPISSASAIGTPTQGLAVDAANNVYLSTVGRLPAVTTELLEVTSGPNGQVIPLTAAASGFFRGDTNAIDGEPVNLAQFSSNAQLAFDPAGRLYLSTPAFNGIAYLDRNGSAIFSTATGAAAQTLTFTNAGTGTLTGTKFGPTSYPYALSPTQAELTAQAASGAPPFSVDTSSGTCLALFGSGSFSLAPGASCTLVIDYTPNAAVPAAGSFTLYTNDPDGPVTVALAATTDTVSSSGLNYLAVSSTRLQPSASQSANGSFTVNATVASSTTTGSANSPTTPTGTVSIGVTNNLTGVQTVQTASLTSGTTTGFAAASASFSGLVPGTYSLQAVYLGDGASSPNYAPVQTLYVRTTPIDFTTFAVADYYSRYVGATAQFLNFSDFAYTNPTAAEFQDFYSGTSSVSNTLLDSTGTALDTTSTNTLGVGHYTLEPSVTHAAQLNYSVTAYPARFFIAPADLTVRAGNITTRYGYLLSPTGTGDATHFAAPITVYAAPGVFSSELSSGVVSLNPTIVGQANAGTTPLPAGQYQIQPTLTGAGAGNYSLTAYPTELQVGPADLTVSHTTTNAFFGQLLISSGTPNDAQFIPALSYYSSSPTAAAELASGTVTLTQTIVGQPNAATQPLLPGNYQITAAVGGAGAANYSLTDHPSLLVIRKEDLTLQAASYTNIGTMTVSGKTLCLRCYTAPYSQLITSDANLQIVFVVKDGSNTIVDTLPYNSPTTITLLPGTYTVTPVISGSNAPYYSPTIISGTLRVIFPLV